MALFRDQFKDRLGKLTGTQESIETLSRWLMFHKKNKSLIVEMWWEEYSAKDGARLNLLYLANDVVQWSKKKYPELAAEFHPILESAFAQLREVGEKNAIGKAARLVAIWSDRGVYTEEQVKSLSDALGEVAAAGKPRSDGRSSAKPRSDGRSSTSHSRAAKHPTAARGMHPSVAGIASSMGSLDALMSKTKKVTQKLLALPAGAFPSIPGHPPAPPLSHSEAESAYAVVTEYKEALDRDIEIRGALVQQLVSLMEEHEREMGASADKLPLCLQQLEHLDKARGVGLKRGRSAGEIPNSNPKRPRLKE